MTLRTEGCKLEECGDWAGPAFKFIQGYCDARVEADTGVVSYFFIFVQLP